MELNLSYLGTQTMIRLVFHGRKKHFKTKYHFVREVEQAKEVTLVHYSLQNQLANILTKYLGKMKFEKLHYDIGVHSMEAKEEYCEITNHVVTNPHCELNSPASSPHSAISTNLRAHQKCKFIKCASSLKLRSHL
ncbi:Integrase, catalytic core [Gossypium australe]|uniref:Integrase, catalytic core n=1 Tax=Gossypium australe TaxID=47621 RepID=A0A5B6X136_9ROSI|nr:Integrase, catalytic core [Gossypium australe]